MNRLLFLISFLISTFLVAQVPSYYGSIDFTQEGNALKDDLSTLIISTHTTLIPYTSMSTDTWDIIHSSDADVTIPNNVILFYGYDNDDNLPFNDRTRSISYQSSGSCIGYWNREHVFAKSLANPYLEINDPGAGTDVHNLRAVDCQMNSKRNNRIFVRGSGASNNSGSYFYPGDEFKGDVARIIMYMSLRYPSQCDPLSVGAGSTSYSPNNDIPDVFLEWNAEDPVSEFERNRNDVIQTFQGNRNPFIDNPYIATQIWGGPSAKDSWEMEFSVSNLYLYPTICKDEIYISNHKSEIRLEFSIFNIDGDEVQKGEAHNYIMFENHPPGTYFLTIRYGESEKSQTIYIL